jgi:hypothetical protein
MIHLFIPQTFMEDLLHTSHWLGASNSKRNKTLYSSFSSLQSESKDKQAREQLLYKVMNNCRDITKCSQGECAWVAQRNSPKGISWMSHWRCVWKMRVRWGESLRLNFRGLSIRWNSFRIDIIYSSSKHSLNFWYVQAIILTQEGTKTHQKKFWSSSKL